MKALDEFLDIARTGTPYYRYEYIEEEGGQHPLNGRVLFRTEVPCPFDTPGQRTGYGVKRYDQ